MLVVLTLGVIIILIIYSRLVLEGGEDTFQPKKGGEGNIKEAKTFFYDKRGRRHFSDNYFQNPA